MLKVLVVDIIAKGVVITPFAISYSKKYYKKESPPKFGGLSVYPSGFSPVIAESENLDDSPGSDNQNDYRNSQYCTDCNYRPDIAWCLRCRYG